MKKNKYQTFAAPSYCDFSAAANAVAGKDLLIGIYANSTQSELLAIAGQTGLTINRSADSIEVNAKTNEGWKDSIPGLKQWSIDLEGLYILDDESHAALTEAFNSGAAVCVVVYKNDTTPDPLLGGMASITDFPIEAPYDDAVTFSCTFTGKGALQDLTDSLNAGSSENLPNV